MQTSAAPRAHQRRANTPQVNRTAAVTDFSQRFHAVPYAAKPLLHHEPGRTVHHNLQRLPSPDLTHDFATSILLGGNHPQNRFRHLNKSFRHAIADMTNGDEARVDEFQQLCHHESDFERHLKLHKVRQRRRLSQQQQQQLHCRSPAADTATAVKSGKDDDDDGSASAALHIVPHRAAEEAMFTIVGGKRGGSGVVAPPPQLQPERTASRGATRDGTRQVALRSRPASRSVTISAPPSRQGGDSRAVSRASTRHRPSALASPLRVASASSSFTPLYLRRREKTWEEAQEFSLDINGDYEAPFAAKEEARSLDSCHFVRDELGQFERRAHAKSVLGDTEHYINTLSTLPHSTFAPPKIIIMLFKFANVRNLSCTKAMRRVGYPELHEQFSTAARNGVITKAQYHQVLLKYLTAAEMLDAHLILQCFDRNALGDVDLNMFLIGLQILLDCATPGDTMRYCFTLMDASSKVPRYITRYEVQTLVGYAAASLASSPSARAASAPSGVDGEFEHMSRAIREMLEEAHRYDYMGRMPLREFLDVLNDKLIAGERDTVAGEGRSAGRRRQRAAGQGQFMFGSVWQGAPVVAAVHRMSSKKMLLASLKPQRDPRDPHARAPDDSS